VMGTHGRRGFKRLLLGSVTETVLREAPCPVLTVPPHVRATGTESVTFKRILCPIDFSASALLALGFALDLARQADGRVTLLHVVEGHPNVEPRTWAQFDMTGLIQQITTDAQERLRALIADESRTWVEIDDLVLEGRAHREILHQADAMAADLIVMGAQGHTGLDLAVFGSSTQYVVRSAKCPVLVVRAPAQT